MGVTKTPSQTFKKPWNNNLLSRSLGTQGLARAKEIPGMFVAYATLPDTVAEDGQGRNGVFTKHVLRWLQEPGIEITEVFRNVRLGVIQETDKKQIPTDTSVMLKKFYFVGAGK